LFPDLRYRCCRTSSLAIFAEVAEARSFAAAVTELKLSKATVSKTVSRVEATRLFNRTSRRIVLTEAGRQLSGRAARVLSEGEDAEAEMAHHRHPESTM